MDFYFSSKVWNEQQEVPNTSTRAQPSSPLAVRNARVIIVKEARYRGAIISGTFVLGNQNDMSLPRNGWQIIEVYCCWFGLRLKTRGLHFKVNMSNAEVVNGYSGLVVSNLSY